MFKPKNILITGAAGFIGSRYVKHVLSAYSDVYVVSFDKLTYAGSLSNLDGIDSSRHIFIQGDICDKEAVRTVLHEYSIDTIVHFAAESHVDNSIADPSIFIKTNVEGTYVLLEQARQYWLQERQLQADECRFHHISTDEVYGSLGFNDPSFTEESAYKPNSPYSASKASSDHLARSYYKTYGLPVTISNCSNNYGANQHKEKLIPVVINSCQQRKPIPIYGAGNNIRDWLYVGDHCAAIDLIIHQADPGSYYNIGGGCEISNLDLVTMICEIFDNLTDDSFKHSSLIKFVEDRKGHDLRYSVCSRKIADELGWNSECSMATILREMIMQLEVVYV